MGTSLSHRLTRLAVGWPRLILGSAFALVAAGIVLGARLTLQTDLSELLPPSAESVIELKALNQRVGGTGGAA